MVVWCGVCVCGVVCVYLHSTLGPQIKLPPLHSSRHSQPRLLTAITRSSLRIRHRAAAGSLVVNDIAWKHNHQKESHFDHFHDIRRSPPSPSSEVQQRGRINSMQLS
jgi:hypothetical protein